jgi:Uma2 family endonuclease
MSGGSSDYYEQSSLPRSYLKFKSVNMATISGMAGNDWTVADLLAHFGPIAHRRIRQEPAPGTATEQHVLDIHDREKRLYELIDGVLVEKAMGVQESFLAIMIARLLSEFVGRQDLGFVLGADGMARLAPGLIRIPDVSFVSWRQVPTRRIPLVAMLGFAPDLAVEILSPGNTLQEMNRKLHDYFSAGVGLVWYVAPADRTVRVYTAVDREIVLQEHQDLTGDPVLPGFALPLRELFAQLEQ